MKTSDELFACLMNDVIPSDETLEEFGLLTEDGKVFIQLYSKMQQDVRRGKVSLAELDWAGSSGPKITGLFGIPTTTKFDGEVPND